MTDKLEKEMIITINNRIKYALLPIAAACGIPKEKAERLRFSETQLVGMIIASVSIMRKENEKLRKENRLSKLEREERRQLSFMTLGGERKGV